MRELGNKEVVLIMANILMVVNKDRHQFLRTEVKWPATIIPSSRPTPAEIKSISQVCASVYCQQIPPPGQKIRLEIKPPNRQSIIVFARAIWAIETGSRETSYRFQFGAQFEYISEEDIQFLGETVANQKSSTEIDEAQMLEHNKRP
jgi:hypothetical protein